jgi:DNA polymerase III delta prime subunit
LAAEVDSINGREVTLFLERDPGRRGVPSSGTLEVDTYATRKSIERQKDALLATRSGSRDVIRPDLGQLIRDPSQIRAATEAVVDHWHRRDLDDDKKTAVRMALASPDFFLVQGPPGTGKTTFISEFIAQLLRRQPNARVLLTSQAHVALDHALAQISDLGVPGRHVRLTSGVGGRIDPRLEGLTLESQLAVWRRDVERASTGHLEEWASRHDLDLRAVRSALRLGQILEVRTRLDDLDGRIEDVEAQLATGPTDVDSEDRVEAAEELSSLRRELVDDRETLVRDLDGLVAGIDRSVGIGRERLGRLPLAELRALVESSLPVGNPAADRFRRLVELQARWLSRLNSSREMEEAVLLESTVVAATCVGLAGARAARRIDFDVCILDEASRATPTESLVPLIRARRWVLVGDPQQLPPFHEEALSDPALMRDLDLDPEELNRTLFDRLADAGPEVNHRMLTQQHRMLKPIGDLISSCFYGGLLTSTRTEGLPGLDLVLPKPVLWLDTQRVPDHLERRAGPSGLSFSNPVEARQIVDFLQRLNSIQRARPRIDDEGRLRILVLAPYRAQVSLVFERYAARSADLEMLDVEVNTVDAAQGREADIVVFSVTRSNVAGRIGFVREEKRLNVALSRARFGLVLVGDLEFAERTDSVLKKVAEHLRLHPESCAIEEAMTP